MGWGGGAVRQIRVFWVAFLVFADYKLTQKYDRWTKDSEKDSLWERTHNRNSKRILHLITKLKGLWVKAGQYLSTRADVLPGPYIRRLRVLQDSLPPRPLSEVYRTVEKELGKPVRELFETFVDIPLATASIAQVHRATAKDGSDVVVKVQHTGIKEIILQDLKNARTIVHWIAWAEPQYDFGPVIDEWCAEVPNELDFNLEAGIEGVTIPSMDCDILCLRLVTVRVPVALFFADILRNTTFGEYAASNPYIFHAVTLCWRLAESTCQVRRNLDFENIHTTSTFRSQVDVLIPNVIQSTEKVLVLEYMDGVRLNDVTSLDSLGVNKQLLVETITRCYAHQIYIDGFFNADPHPGNFLVSRQPPFKPILLDFGLTKTLTFSTKQALAKMLLACAEGDYVALLSAFSEMGLKLRLDMPEEAMEVTNFFFRRSIPAKEALDDVQNWSKEREDRLKRIQERAQQENDKNQIRNPVDAYPGDAVFFMRVLNLLRGLSASLDTRVVYLDIMKPFAEAALLSGTVLENGPQFERNDWIYGTPVHSEVEQAVHSLLVEMSRQQRILGIQVCAYKDGKVVIDTAAGVLGKYDPRPVQPDSLFPVFSTTKGVTAGLVHWLIDHGKLNLSDKVADLWPEFGTRGKEACTVAHVLNHTAGLHSALSDTLKTEPLFICNFADCLNRIAAAEPQSPPGSKQAYHAMTFGWICGGIIERVSKMSFKEFLEHTFTEPLGVSGEFYIGIPPGVEARLASLTIDIDELRTMLQENQVMKAVNSFMTNGRPVVDTVHQQEHQDNSALAESKVEAEAASSMPSGNALSLAASLPVLFNALFIRRAVVPAANGHFSARALARYYAMLASGGQVPAMSSTSQPPLGSHPQIPTNGSDKLMGEDARVQIVELPNERLFTNSKLVEAVLGTGEYSKYTMEGPFGLGFMRLQCDISDNTSAPMPFGHSGLGGTTGFCSPEHNFAIAITLNKMNMGDVASEVVRVVCRELDIPCPLRFRESGKRGVDMTLDLAA